ncbi:JmjC domain-containing protein [Cynara cardunculus var. scolymus]|uniref:JmjC domain-containing protein n=1 Tax=Cynara cardunculus var. scolymus TaxID=59895 RepID=A0A103XV22_CYNCS|nr:JmjC domain-containing protein [Cynara cardunculus var. scolymus]
MPNKLNRNRMEFSSFSEASSSRKHLKSCMFGSFSKKGFQRDQSRTTDDLEWINRITECPVYHPAIEDFEDPLEYLQKIAPEASKYGISYTLRDFEVMANRVTANKYCLSGCLPSAYLEREFWVEMMHGKKGTVEYGVNVDGKTSKTAEISTSAAHEFEKVIRRHVYTREILPTDGGNGAFELLAEKTTMFPPKILLQNRIPVYKVVQSPGEFKPSAAASANRIVMWLMSSATVMLIPYLLEHLQQIM